MARPRRPRPPVGGPAPARPVPAPPPPQAVPVLDHATRQVLKATLAPLQTDVPGDGQAILKFGYLRQELTLQSGEVDFVRRLSRPVATLCWKAEISRPRVPFGVF